ncbi:glycosyltransferase family 4 protein [Streptoverticillium reticulum]|uniref:glycosyltransferase family 4 protein n=1 Tax=Streptoverticillium reticulum TaxID=1433415 RepID=UPI0039BF25AB
MKIAFLLHNRYGIGGVIQSTLNLAGTLAGTHTVEIVSTRRDRDHPALPLDPRVHVVDLVDTRATSYAYDGKHPLYTAPPLVYPEGDEVRINDISRLTEVRLGEYLSTSDADVIIATNPGISVCLATMGPGHIIRVAQEHQALATPDSPLGQRLNDAYRELDAVVTVNTEDEQRARLTFGHAGTRIETIPNCIPPTPLAPSDLSSKTVIAAGRLAPVKRFHELVQAFERVVAERPDWTLRIFGVGPERGRILDEIKQRNLSNHVFLMGSSSRMEVEWAKAALAVSSSHAEAFSLVIVEAARVGVPTISTACDGPRGIITHGTDGLLTPTDDPDALADAMLSLIQDDERRRYLGHNALKIAPRYAPEAVAAAYDELLARLQADQKLPDRADWWTTTSGDVVIRMMAPGKRAEDLRLLCVSGDGNAAQPHVSLPLQPAAQDTGEAFFTACIRREDLPLSEGLWELYVESADGQARRRLRTGICDNRTLLDLPVQPSLAQADQPALVSLIPHSGPDDTIDVRVWVRARHAEVINVEVLDQETLVTVELRGTEPQGALSVIAQSRRNSMLDFPLPVREQDGRRLRFAIPYPEFGRRHHTAHSIWDLYLCEADTTPVRIAGLTGDCINRKAVYRYPATVLETTPRGRARTRTFYTIANELSVNVVDLPGSGHDEAVKGLRRLRRKRRPADEAKPLDQELVEQEFAESADALPREELVELCLVREAHIRALQRRLDDAQQALTRGAAELARLGQDMAREEKPAS